MTSLANQLQRLQQRPTEDKRLTESFLFGKSDAKSFSREQILQLATTGLQTLVAMDNRFHPFIDDLFNPQQTRQERKMMTSSESKSLDLRLEHFLTLLSPHLFLTAAQQVFEYLVRVHEVHVYNVSAVLRAFLPYHDHNLFARALMLLDLRDTGFSFLATNQERGAPLLREHLVLACAESRKALRLVCMTMAMPARLKIHHNAANALFASVATALATQPGAEAIWRVLLPFVVEFLSGSVSGSEIGAAADMAGDALEEDERLGAGLASAASSNSAAVCTALVVLAVWSSESKFSIQMVTTVVKPIIALLQLASTSTPVVPLGDLLMLLDLLVQSQYAVVSAVAFSPHVAAMLALPWSQWAPRLVDTVAEAEAAGVTAFQSLLGLLCSYCTQRLQMAHSLSSVPSDVLAFVRSAVEQLPLSDRLVEQLVGAVILSEEAFLSNGDADAKVEKYFGDVVAAIERRFQRVFDAALSNALRGEEADTSKAAKAFLGRHLAGTRYQLLEVSGSGGQKERLPLFACLLHPMPEVRAVAGAALENMTVDQMSTSTTAATSGGSLLELLAHVAQYESNTKVAEQFLRSAASALKKLAVAAADSTGDKAQFYAAAVKGLLRSFHMMVNSLPVSVQSQLFQQIHAPLLESAPNSKKQKKTAAATSSPVQATVLYYTVLLYVSVAGRSTVTESQKKLLGQMEAALTALAPAGIARTSAMLKTVPRTTSTSTKSKKRNDSDSSDDDEKNAKETDATTTVLAVLESSELMAAIYPEAKDHLQQALSSARSLLRDEAASPDQHWMATTECAVTSAASLLCSAQGPSAASSLLNFFVGASSSLVEGEGYLHALQAMQRTSARQAQSGESRVVVGRGAQNGLLHAAYLPTNDFTSSMGAVIQGAVRVSLQMPEVSDAALLVMLQLMGYLGAPLPLLAENLAALPAAILGLLDAADKEDTSDEDNSNGTATHLAVDWFALVENALSSPAGRTQLGDLSTGALSLCLLFPLYAPSASREGLLQVLQDAILRGMSGKKTTPQMNSMQMVMLAAAQPQKHLPKFSVTVLSSIVECMARAESRFSMTETAAELMSTMLADVTACGTSVIPHGLACKAVEFFFALPDASAKKSASLARLHLPALMPRIESALVLGAGPATTKGKKSSASEVPAVVAQFVDAVCRRITITGQIAVEEDPAVSLAVTLLQRPYLRVAAESGSSQAVRPIYRLALSMLAPALQFGLEDSEGSVIFTRNKATSSAKKGGSATFSEALAAHVSSTLIKGVMDIGSDMARICVLTKGGYHRVFMPFVEVCRKSSSDENLEAVVEMLEALAPQQTENIESAWQPTSECAVSVPLRYAHAMQVLQLLKGYTWTREPSSLVRLRLLSALLKVSAAVQYDDDEDQESLLHLVSALLAQCPLDAMLPLLQASSGEEQLATVEGSTALLGPYTRQVLTYLQDIVRVCVEQPMALSEKDPRGAFQIRSAVLKQGLVTMAAMLLKGEESSNEDISKMKVDAISELLRSIAPLLVPVNADSAAVAHKSSGSFLLHIPLVALLVRLEPVEYSDTLRFKSAADVCREIIVSFDIHTQINCVSELMRLVVEPHTQLEGKHANEEGVPAEMEEVVQLFRKMVKPNQIINRQESLLHVINTTVKADAFLAPFIELQHHANKQKQRGGAKGDDEDADAAVDEAAMNAAATEGTRTNNECMRLLISALEMFSHYSDLNQNTANDLAASGEEGSDLFGEQKSYAMLLELLSGNALACVLAGINEPTFVECQLRLLRDSRPALQLKGLEVLLDRLHHSLPTLENVLSDEEMEQHRKDLRDPKKKLTLMDLVRIKARPLTTKRSFSLMDHLQTLLKASLKSAMSATRKLTSTQQVVMPVEAALQLFRIAHLSLACAEELIRIVGSGGSTQAEKTLLNVNRSKRVTEAQLAKLLGNKARVQLVHDLAGEMCETMVPKLTQTLLALLSSQGQAQASFEVNSASAKSVGAFKTVAEEGIVAALSAIFTVLGTTTQVMGSAFTATHCMPILQTIVSAAVYQVVDLPFIVTRGEGGSMLRHATLSCLIRCFPSCWQMSQPFLSRIIFVAIHQVNVDDAETNYLCTEVLAVLEALMEPHLFVEASTECLRGIAYINSAVLSGSEQQAAMALDAADVAAKKAVHAQRPRLIKVTVSTHSYSVFFGCIERRIQNLKKEELVHMSIMMEGNSPQNNFWLAAMQSLAASPSVPPSDVIQPVLVAFTSFFLKFKPKHCTKFLRTMAEWAFGGNASEFSKNMAVNGDDDDDDDMSRPERLSVSRTTIHGWLLFYALFNHLAEKLTAILDFAFPVVVPYMVTTLRSYCSSDKTSAVKQMGSLIALTLEGALNSARLMSAAQTPGADHDYSIQFDVLFTTTEVFNGLMPALVRQITNTAYLSDEVHDFEYRAETVVTPALRAFFKCLGSSKLQSKTQSELLRGLRHPNRQVRRATLVCLDGIYADGGEELAARLMAEMLPAVVELTEDRDDLVVEEVRKLCTNLSHMTGQDVLHAMS